MSGDFEDEKKEFERQLQSFQPNPDRIVMFYSQPSGHGQLSTLIQLPYAAVSYASVTAGISSIDEQLCNIIAGCVIKAVRNTT